MHQRLDLSRRRAAGINGPFNLACGGRLRAASRLNGYYSDQPRSQDGWHHNSLLRFHGSRAGLEQIPLNPSRIRRERRSLRIRQV